MPDNKSIATPASVRVWNKVTKTNECWIWTGSVNHKGYGQIKDGSQRDGTKRMRIVHRVVYESLRGPIPEGLDIDHLCRVHACVNPAHLDPVTRRENLMRGEGIAAMNSKKTHCPQGHPYDESNTYLTPNRKRTCRQCRRENQRRYALKQRLAQ